MTPSSEPIALVTGAASGIGRATARELLRRGHRVAALDRDEPALIALAEELGDRLLPCVGDVTDAASIDAAVAAILDAGPIGVLANVAGVGSTQTVVDTPPEVWDAVFDVNVAGIYRTCRAVLPSMIARRQGVIVNAAS